MIRQAKKRTKIIRATLVFQKVSEGFVSLSFLVKKRLYKVLIRVNIDLSYGDDQDLFNEY